MITLTASGEMPEQSMSDTAWLRANIRKGAAIVTDKNGVRRRTYLPVTYRDANGVEQRPLFPPTDEPTGKRYHDQSAKPQLD